MNKPILLLFPLWFIASATMAGSAKDAEVLAQAHRWQMEFRQGNQDVVKPLVKSLEDAVAQSPDNALLWEALGHAYMAQQGASFTSPPDFPLLIATGERARNAYAHSLALNGKSAVALASHGMSNMVVSQLKGDGPGMSAGIDEMNAAVLRAPKSTVVRLTRAFTLIQLPPGMRDNNAVIEDLGFILDTAPGGRPEDVLHVLLGDVYYETGKRDSARAEYRQVTGVSAFAAEQVKSRLTDAAIQPAAIAKVRFGIGTRCAMCHAPGTDN